jgi:hypothetical protein
MQIQEMRSAISAQNLGSGHVELPSSMPDWAVRRVFEKRNGLPLSALPANVRTLKASEMRSFIAGPQKRTAITPAVTELKRAADLVRKGIAADEELADMKRIHQRISLLS